MSAQFERQKGFEDDRDENDLGLFKVLTPEDAQALRSRDPSVSPWQVVLVQVIVGVACVLVVWAVTQRSITAWSALYGAAAAVLPNALMARGMTRRAKNPMAAAAGFMFWQMLKIGAAVAMLVIAARVIPNLSWPALLVTMFVCIKVNWVALLWRGRRLNNKASKKDGS